MKRFLLLAALWLADMTLMSAAGPIGSNPYLFMAGFGVGALLMVAMVAAFPVDLPPGTGVLVILLIAAVGRLCFWTFPPDDDIYRYLWEGHVQRFGLNPYLHAPSTLQFSAADQAYPGLRDAVNHPEFPAVYPPLVLLVFRYLATVHPDPQLFKGLFLLLDLGTIAILSGLVRSLGCPVSRVLFYAVNPLSVVYVSGEAHLDVIQVFLMTAGMWGVAAGRERTGFFLLGAAVMSKILAVVVLPFFINAGNWKKALFALVPVAVVIPFADAGLQLFDSLLVFGTRMHFNDAITSLIRPVFAGWTPLLSALLLSAALAMIWLVEPVPIRSAFLAVAALLMLLPTLHPWYLLMVLPFLAVYPSPAWIYLSAGVALTFPVLGHEFQTGVFQERHWIKWIEYLPFFGFLIYGAFRGKREGEPFLYGAVSTVSVVIPTLNESRRIDRCLDSLAGQEGIQEIIVVDGGSHDDTLRKARLRGLTVLESTPGRGRQIRMGTETAASDLILVLHGDSRLRSGTARRLIDHLNRRPEVPGGALGMVFEPVSFRTRAVSLLNAFRARFIGISFGDQGQYVRTEVLDRMGGFPELDLMEDVELSLRLKSFGRPGYLPGGIVVSDRRWQDGGFAGKVGIVVWLCLRYLAERRWRGAPGKTSDYYDVYYRRHLK